MARSNPVRSHSQAAPRFLRQRTEPKFAGASVTAWSSPNLAIRFIGTEKAVPLPNLTFASVDEPEEFRRYLLGHRRRLYALQLLRRRTIARVPSKIFEYFAFGIPVVPHLSSTSGNTKTYCISVIRRRSFLPPLTTALNEPPDSPKRSARIEIAQRHSLQNLAGVLRGCLPLEADGAHAGQPSSYLEPTSQIPERGGELPRSSYNLTVPSL